MNLPGPLRLEPVCLQKVWAAPALADVVGAHLEAPANTGEVWLASGRGQVTPVAQGLLKGLGLDEVTARWPEWILGSGLKGKAEFPLLLKILSVGQWLSVQVHPDDQAARRLENEPWGKTEAWRVLEAKDGAQIVLGLAPGLDRAGVKRALEQGELVQALAKVPARPGDTFHIPAGTIHATGPGLTIFEIQQASDVTYRFYDWDRLGDDGKPRELHQEKALQVMSEDPPGRPVPAKELAAGGNQVSLLVEDKYFGLLECRLGETYETGWGGQRPRVLFALSGRAQINPGQSGFEPEVMEAGQSWLIPAGLDKTTVTPLEGRAHILESVALG